MKCFYHTRYRFYKPQISTTPSFFLISDVHFSPKVHSGRLNAITKHAAQQKPDYIIIAGDLVDSLDAIDTTAKLRRLCAWLTRLGEVAPVFIGLGNHDFYRCNPKYKNIFSKERHWYTADNQHLTDALRNLDNVHLLDNQSFEDRQLYIFGFTTSPDYYQLDHEDSTTTVFHPGNEDKNILRLDLKQLDPKLLHDLPPRKAKIAIVHSPVYLNDPAIAPFFADFDFIISGHMHNGIVPPLINDFWHSDRGFYAPGKHFFPHQSRGHVASANQKTIICGAVSTFQDSAKPLTFLNAGFPVFTASLECTHRETYARKPDVKRQYLSFPK